MTNGNSGRLAVLEVMVEMLTAQSMTMEADPDKALADYGQVAVTLLSMRHSDAEMDDLVPLLAERTAKVRGHIEKPCAGRRRQVRMAGQTDRAEDDATEVLSLRIGA